MLELKPAFRRRGLSRSLTCTVIKKLDLKPVELLVLGRSRTNHLLMLHANGFSHMSARKNADAARVFALTTSSVGELLYSMTVKAVQSLI